MKFVVASDFKNVPVLGIEPVEGAPHEDHIPKGARIEIGKGENLSDLSVKDQEHVGLLYHAGRIVSMDNEKAIKLIDAEIAMEKKKLAREKEAAAKVAAPAK